MNPSAWLPRRHLTRGGLVLVDQGVSTASNGLFSFAIATTVSADVYGSFALSYTILGAGLVMWRRSVLLEFSVDRGDHEDVHREAEILAFLLRMAPLLALAPLLILTVARVGISPESVALALIGPIVLAQDTLRIAHLSKGNSGRALLSDGVWLAVSGATLTLAITSHIGYGAATAAWCIGAVAALAIVVDPRRRAVTERWRQISDAPAFLARRQRRRIHNAVTGSIGPLTIIAMLSIIGRIAGNSVVATITGTALLMFPITILLSSIPLLLTTGGPRNGPGVKRIMGLVLVCVAVTGLWLVVLVALPDAVGTAVLGATWTLVQPLLVLGAAAAGAQAVEVTLTSALQLRGRSRAPLVLSGVANATRVAYSIILSIVIGTAAAIMWANLLLSAAVALVALAALRRYPRLPLPLEPPVSTDS